MNIIFKITKRELQNLFYSPVAWFLAILFLLQCAYYYITTLNDTAIAIDAWKANVPSFTGILGDYSETGALFFSSVSIIPNVFQTLFLFLPLLTMGIMSREINNGTIKLLYSSPIKLRHIVLGKYLAVMTFTLMLIVILVFFMINGAFHVKSIDYGWLLSALLGFCLLAGAYSAIGLFMSSLTTYQIVSGIGTFAVFFILSRIGGLWQKYDFVRDLTWFLAISGRTEQMLAGLITSRDVIYFILVIFMFLSFTLFKLKGEKESKPWTTKAVRYVGVIVVSLVLGYITSRPALVGYLDTTAEQQNTIKPEMQQILKKMGKEPLQITLYANLFGGGLGAGLPEARNAYLYGFWDKYIRFKPDIKFKYVYYYDNGTDSTLLKRFPKKTLKQIAGMIAAPGQLDSSMFMPPEEIHKQIDPSKEDLKLFMTARYKRDSVNLRVYGDSEFWPDQREVASKFKRLVEKKWPKVYFVTGNLERSIHKTGEREYSDHTRDIGARQTLVNFAFDVDTLSLEKQEIPVEATALVLADPKTELGNITRKKLEQYIARGGNLMVLGEPGKQAILNPVLLQLGIQLMKGQLVQLSANETPDKITPYMPVAGLDLVQLNKRDRQLQLEGRVPDTAYKSLMVGAVAMSYQAKDDFKITPILKTLPDNVTAIPTKKVQSGYTITLGPAKPITASSGRQTWIKMGRLVTDSVPPVFSPTDGDLKAPSFTTAVYLTRQVNNKQQRIIVLGDADNLSNQRYTMWNGDFYNWFDYGEYPVYIPQTHYKDNMLTVSAATTKILKITYIWILPTLLLLTGTILLIRRKRK